MNVSDTTPTGHAVLLEQLPLILLVEDNPDDATLLLEALRERQILARLITASTPVQAYSALRLLPSTGLPKLILVDLGLPMMSGHELIRGLSNNAEWRKIPTVVLTSSSRETDRIHSLRSGASAHLIKPSRFDEYLMLADEIGRYLVPPAATV
jgi:two-component system response regulator